MLQQGNQRDRLEHPRSSYIAELVGTNFFRGRLVRLEAQTICTIRVRVDGREGIEIKAVLARQAFLDGKPPEGAEAYVGVVPRTTTLSLSEPSRSASNLLHAAITHL